MSDKAKQKPNTHENFNASVFKNKFKKQERQPDFTGQVEIEGKEYQIAMWERKDKNGDPFYSFSFSPKMIREAKPEPEVDTAEQDNPFGF